MSETRDDDNAMTLDSTEGGPSIQPADGSSHEQEQLFPERKRSQFSYNSNELRRRHAGKPAEQESSSGTTRTESHGGGGFYECNIW